MWMASASYLEIARKRRTPAYRWDAKKIKKGEALLLDLLGEVGDRARERVAVLPITLVCQRALTDEEIERAKLRGVKSSDSFGVPLRIVRATQTPELTSMPCEVGGVELVRYRGMLIPSAKECGACPSCIARRGT